MNGSWNNSGGGCGLARGKSAVEPVKRRSHRVILGGRPGFALQTAEQLQLLGWDVCTASDDAEIHALASKKSPTAVVLPIEAEGESGFLFCAKLRLSRPKVRVVLVGDASPRAQRMAGFVGAGVATDETAADMVLKLI